MRWSFVAGLLYASVGFLVGHSLYTNTETCNGPWPVVVGVFTGVLWPVAIIEAGVFELINNPSNPCEFYRRSDEPIFVPPATP